MWMVSRIFKRGLVVFPVCVLLLVMLAQEQVCSVRFFDDFSDGGQSNLNWTAITAAREQLEFIDGHARLVNGSDEFGGFAIHTLSQKSGSFTFHCRLLSDLPGAGLFYCTGKESGRYTGYGLIVGDGELIVLEYAGDDLREVTGHTVPFLDTVGNVLALSSGEGCLRVFCNGYFQFSFENRLGEAGDVGIIVPPGSALSFDDVEILDSVADTLRFPPFCDNLELAQQPGWTLWGNGNHELSAEGMRVTTTTSQTWRAGIFIPMDTFTVSVLLRVENGAGQQFAGIIVGFEPITPDTSLAVRFGINGGPDYAVERCRGGGHCSLLATGGFLGGDQVTLKVSGNCSLATFFINDQKVEQIEDVVQGRLCISAGIFSDESLSVSFREFVLVDARSENTVKNVHEKRTTIQKPIHKRAMHLYTDLAGRVIERDKIVNHHNISSVWQIVVSPTGRAGIYGLR